MWMHISHLFSKFKVFIQSVKKKKVLQKKEAEFENLSLHFQGFFLVHALSSFLPTMLLLLIFAQYQKYDLMILLRVNAYNNTLNMEYHNGY